MLYDGGGAETREFALAKSTGDMDFGALFDLPDEIPGQEILELYASDDEFWSIVYGAGLNWEEYSEFDADRLGQEDYVEEVDIPAIPVFVHGTDTPYIRDASTHPSFTPPIGNRSGVYNVHEVRDPEKTGDGILGFNGLLQKLSNFEVLKYRHRERSYHREEVESEAVESYLAEYQQVIEDIGEDVSASMSFVTADEENYDTELERNPGYVLKILPGVQRIGDRLENAGKKDLTLRRDFVDDFMATTYDEVVAADDDVRGTRISSKYRTLDEYAQSLVKEIRDADAVDKLRAEFRNAVPFAERWLN